MKTRRVTQLPLPYPETELKQAKSALSSNSSAVAGRASRAGKGRGSPARSTATAPSKFKRTIDESDSAGHVSNHVVEALQEGTGGGSELQGLWEYLPDVEQELMRKQSKENLRRYEKIVRKISFLTIAQNTRLRTMERKNSSGKKQKYQMIDVLDRKIQKLTLMLFDKGNRAFQLYRTFAEIRGLILDINK